jgi:hypothetical protein
LILSTFGIVFTFWGIYTVYLLLRDPNSLTETENHPSWKHMYLMMRTLMPMARVCPGRDLLLGLPDRLQNRPSNKLRPAAGASWSNPLQAIGQLIVYLYKE